jgi:hypothetical protein
MASTVTAWGKLATIRMNNLRINMEMFQQKHRLREPNCANSEKWRYALEDRRD